MAVDKDISYALIDGIFDTLNNSVTVNAVTYPVYKSIPVSPATTYVKIGEVITSEDGHKDGLYRDWETDRKSTRLNSSHSAKSRMPSSA